MKPLIDFVDNFLNRITMYRLVLYYLIVLWVAGLLLSFFGILPYSPLAMIMSLTFILSFSWITNDLFARAFNVPTNVESLYITGFILALIITPFGPAQGYSYLFFLAFASIWAMVSKFLITIKRKHIFNPAALAVALTAFTVGQSASWWVGNAYLAPLVFLGGFLMVRKIRRTDMVASFFASALLAIVIPGLIKGTSLIIILEKAVFYSPFLFFAFVMLTEPLTTPPRKWGRIFYGVLVGFLFSPAFHIGSLYTTPELALLAGNVFSYLISPKQKLMLTLQEKIPIGTDLYELVFSHNGHFQFRPGQYLEWTMGHENPDKSGNRRYFTVASSPTENEIRIGIKYNNGSSSFKRALLTMKKGDTLSASQLAGDFTLPRKPEKKLVFIAGGIGITPFRSMIKYVLDKNEKRDITLFYSNKTPGEIVYKNIFDAAQEKLGIKTIYTLTDSVASGPAWCRHGRIDSQMITSELPDCLDRTYYISGPHAMVMAYQKMLKDMGVSYHKIKTDFFPGFI